MDLSTIIIDISLFCGLYFQIFLLVTFFNGEKKEKMKKIKAKAAINVSLLPTVSIIVPCFNEARTLEKTVMSILGLDYPKDKLSILIVDDGSTDDTYTVARNVATRLAKSFKNINVISQENGGKFTALNFGIRHSTADFVSCLDADSTVDSQALIRMIPYFKDEKVMAVTPAMRAITSDMVNGGKPTILQQIQRAEYNIGIFNKKVYGMINAIHVTPGPFSVFRRTVFEKIGYFRHAHNTEDMEIAFRIQSKGYRIANCYNAFVYTITPATLNKLYRQRTRWTCGFIKNLIDYRQCLFNKKYGNMGMLTMPFAVLGIGFVFYFAGQFIYHIGVFVYNTYDRIATVGFISPHFSFTSLTGNFSNAFHNLYFSLGMSTVLAVILFIITLYIIFRSKKMAEGSMKPSMDIFYFVFLYSFIAPIWIGKSVYNVVFSRKTPWR
jgi:cellulose synthase/poly-beta-1,6-N-acetylglucosamine synthase-like glycosyltransferase